MRTIVEREVAFHNIFSLWSKHLAWHDYDVLRKTFLSFLQHEEKLVASSFMSEGFRQAGSSLTVAWFLGEHFDVLIVAKPAAPAKVNSEYSVHAKPNRINCGGLVAD